MLAQPPTVTNVQAEQIAGTKDVSIQAEITGKLEGAYGGPVLGEVWFKENEADNNWIKVSSIYGEIDPGAIQRINLSDHNPDTGETNYFPTIYFGEIGNAPVSKTLTWKAGDDAPNINTSSAKIKIIAFYPKKDEANVPKPDSEQTSGWNGEGDFGGSGGNPDNNGTSPSGEVYVRDYADTNNYYVSTDPNYPSLRDRLTVQYGISPIAPTSYIDDASGAMLDVFELPDGLVMELTGTIPPSGMLLCAVEGDFFIPVILQ